MRMILYRKNAIRFEILFAIGTAFLLGIFAGPRTARGEYSMRRCMVLPIQDNVGGAIGHKVFEEVEQYLREAHWCYYVPNSEIVNILSGYRNNLSTHLANPEVLRVISRKIQVGSLIRVRLEGQAKGMDVTLEVVGENGDDLYFREKTRLQKDDVKLVAQVVANWLEQYGKVIPYDGMILGILGNQFTVDMGKDYDIKIGDEVILRRPLRKKKHPLLKEIVEWETELLAKGKISSISDQQAMGVINEVKNNKNPVMGDWVSVDISSRNKEALDTRVFEQREEEGPGYDFGKLGTAGLSFIIGQGENTTGLNRVNRRIGGLQYGLLGAFELWVTRNFWGSAEIGQIFGSYKKKEGSVTKEKNSLDMGIFKMKGGYKYLPMGYFYGPQMDFYLGYAKYTYALDTVAAEGFGEASFTGLVFGLKAGIPLLRELRLAFKMDFILNPTYTEDVAIYGESDSSSSYHFELGAIYAVNMIFSLEGAVQVTSNRAKFTTLTGTQNELRFRDTSLRSGVLFTF